MSLLARSLTSLGAVAGLGAAFVVGTSYGGSGSAAPDPWHGGGTVDASPAAYDGSGLSVQDSCDDLLRWYVGRGTEIVGAYGWNGYSGPIYTALDGARTFDSAAGSTGAESPVAPAPVRSTNGETGTNVQEAGVDEPDVVKTDGHTLFRVQDGALVTYDLSGPTVQRLASVALPGALGGDSTEILLSGDTVVALSTHGGDEVGSSYGDQQRGDLASTDLVSVDVSDPAHPGVSHTVHYPSGLVTARLHDGVVRVVLRAGLPDLAFTQPDKTTTEYEAAEANADAVRASTLEDWLPTASLDGADPTPLLDCEDVAVPDDDAALGTIAIVGFDASAPEAASVTGLAVDTDLAYASADQLYLATRPAYVGILDDCADCRGLVEPPMPMPMPQSQSRFQLPGWLTRALGGGGATEDSVTGSVVDDGASHLYAFDLDGIDTAFAAAGEVDGVIRDRWSVDATGSGPDAVLRVAVGPGPGTGSSNSLVTLRQEGNDLVEAGRLDDLGVGEDIESVRWFDTLAIVVTFRQVDPLYAVDLTDPEQPRLMGSLKIPGFSAYLHPLGQHRLLGLGQLPGSSGAWGAQAGLFDVTDLTRPRQLDVVAYGPDTRAGVETDPRQLTWLPDDRTVLAVVDDPFAGGGGVGYVSVLTLGGGRLSNRMVEVEHGDEVAAVRLVPLADGRVVLVTGDDASFFDL
jgi:hypothetical protein